MRLANVDGFDYTFQKGYSATRYDSWHFYAQNKSFSNKAVDILALSDDKIGYCIEIKDYCHDKAILPSHLPETLYAKVRDTLAMLLPAAVNAEKAEEKNFARKFLKIEMLRFFFHIEQPQHKIPAIDMADIKQKLQYCMRAIDKDFRIISIDSKDLPFKIKRSTNKQP